MMRVDQSVKEAFRSDGAILAEGLLTELMLKKCKDCFDWSVTHPSDNAAKIYEGTADEHYNDISNPDGLEIYKSLLEEAPFVDFLTELWESEHIWFLSEEIFIKNWNKVKEQFKVLFKDIHNNVSLYSELGPEGIVERLKSFQQRRDFILNELKSIKGISCLKPEGAFYVFPSCSNLLGKKDPNGKFLKTDNDFVESLLENQGIAVVQGSAFGLNGFFRISYATSMDNLKKAMKKIKIFCENFQ